MPVRDWFRPPRSLLTLYLVGAGVAVVCLTWLAFLQVSQDDEVEAQRTATRLGAAATLAATRSQQALVELDRLIAVGGATAPAHVHLLDVRGAVFTVLSGRLPFLPTGLASTDIAEGVFEAGEHLEVGEDFTGAAAHYRAVAVSSSRSVRAGALMRQGRALRLLNRHDEALKVYTNLAPMPDVVIDGRPADLIARMGRCQSLDALDRREDLAVEASSLRADLARGRWPVASGLWHAVFEETLRWAGTPAPASLEDDLAAAEALLQFWKQRPSAPPTNPRRLITETPRGLSLIVEQPHPNGGRVLVTGPAYLSTLQQQLSDSTTLVRLASPDSRAVQMDGPPLSLHPLQSGLPWMISVADTDPDRVRSESRRRRAEFLGVLALVDALILASGYFTFRGIRREVATARLQSEFVSAVSHEFRTPLTSIRQLSHMLHGGRVYSDERRAQYYGVLVRESERLHRLVERLLSFGRADAERFRFEPLDACDLARTVVAEFTRQSGARAIDVSTSPVPCQLRADREMLALALWNLIDNAVKYSSDPEPVRVDVSPRDGRVAIAVQDRGVGIPTQDQRRIFEQFVRGSADRVAETSGSGLGLALVDRVVRAHGGSIELTSEPGRGSVFTMLVPMEMESAA